MEPEQKKLEEWILEKGFTQRSFAREAGVSDTIINLIVTGKRTKLRGDTMGKIAKALDVAVRQIVEFDRAIKDQLGKGSRQPGVNQLAEHNVAAMGKIAATP